MTTKPPSKRTLAAIARRQRQVAKGLGLVSRNIARERCRQVSRNIPAAHQQWGATKAAAWLSAASRCAKLATMVKPTALEMWTAADTVEAIPDWDADQCAAYLNQPKTKGANTQTS